MPHPHEQDRKRTIETPHEETHRVLVTIPTESKQQSTRDTWCKLCRRYRPPMTSGRLPTEVGDDFCHACARGSVESLVPVVPRGMHGAGICRTGCLECQRFSYLLSAIFTVILCVRVMSRLDCIELFTCAELYSRKRLLRCLHTLCTNTSHTAPHTISCIYPIHRYTFTFTRRYSHTYTHFHGVTLQKRGTI